MTMQALEDYCCPYASEETNRFITIPRKCKITGQLCFNWYKIEAVEKCEVRKQYERRQGQ